MATTFKIGDPVIVSDTASLNHGTYGAVSGTGTVYGYDEVLVEFDRDGTTHKFDASQLTALDQPDGGGQGWWRNVGQVLSAWRALDREQFHRSRTDGIGRSGIPPGTITPRCD